jgi:general secretion pathway protein A
MYEQFFGFRERPFDLTTNPRYVVLTEPHREALSNLEYGIASRKGITLLIGEAGSGKTTMIRAALEKQPVRVHSVHLQNPTLTRKEFGELLAAHFGLSKRASASKASLLLELEALLRERRDRDESSVLIIDEGQSLSMDLLEEIRLLVNIDTHNEKLLSVIMAGQPELAAKLDDRALRQLKQRIALRCELRPLTPAETAAYVAGRIRAAGGVGAKVFTREAVAMIHERARGLPRTISVLADNALLTGFAAGQRPVSSQVVREVCADFSLEGGSPATRDDDDDDDDRSTLASTTSSMNGQHDSRLLAIGSSTSQKPEPGDGSGRPGAESITNDAVPGQMDGLDQRRPLTWARLAGAVSGQRRWVSFFRQ